MLHRLTLPMKTSTYQDHRYYTVWNSVTAILMDSACLDKLKVYQKGHISVGPNAWDYVWRRVGNSIRPTSLAMVKESLQ